MKKYILYIKSGCAYPDYEDECWAESINEATDKLFSNNLMRGGWTKDEIKAYIYEEPEAVKTDLF